MACDAQTLINAACDGGYDGLDDRRLNEALAYLMCNGGGGGQIIQYTADPTAEGLTPTNQDNPAVAYAAGGTGVTYTWNTTTHEWQ